MYVMGDNGVFGKAKNAKEQIEATKAREKLELLFSSLQIEKYEQGLTEEELDARITEEINKIGGNESGDDRSQVIVDGYIFQIDRGFPRIIEELGLADGIIITAVINGNKGWLKEGESATVTGIIKTYSGGNITNVSATKDGTVISDFSIDGEGRYEITGITSDTTIEIKAKDSNNKEKSKIVPITIKIDNTVPTAELKTEWIEEEKRNRLKITVSNAQDDNSGINENAKVYITSEDGIKNEKSLILINGTGYIDIEGLNIENKTTVEIIVSDNAGNKFTKQKNVGTKYIIKNGELCVDNPVTRNGGQYNGQIINSNGEKVIQYITKETKMSNNTCSLCFDLGRDYYYDYVGMCTWWRGLGSSVQYPSLLGGIEPYGGSWHATNSAVEAPKYKLGFHWGFHHWKQGEINLKERYGTDFPIHYIEIIRLGGSF